MKNKKILLIIVVLAIVAVFVSAAMRKTNIFFNRAKTETHQQTISQYSL